MATGTTSSLLFSLAFLYMTPGPIQDAIKQLQEENRIFSYGISDAAVRGLELTKPDGTVSVIGTAALKKNLPRTFQARRKDSSDIRRVGDRQQRSCHLNKQPRIQSRHANNIAAA